MINKKVGSSINVCLLRNKVKTTQTVLTYIMLYV